MHPPAAAAPQAAPINYFHPPAIFPWKLSSIATFRVVSKHEKCEELFMGRQVLTRSLFLITLLLAIAGLAQADPIKLDLQSGSLTSGGASVLTLNGTGL